MSDSSTTHSTTTSTGGTDMEAIIAIGAEVVSTVFDLVKSAFSAKAAAKAAVLQALTTTRDALRQARADADVAEAAREKQTSTALGEDVGPPAAP